MNVDLHVSQMRALSKQLVPYSFPLASQQDEEIISCLKQREINIDGYDLVVYFNTCCYQGGTFETLQIFSRYFTFIPFAIVCKIAKKFLGTKELTLIEVFSADEHKIYIWTVYYKDNEIIKNPFMKNPKSCVYGDLEYNKIDKDQVNFF